MLMEAFHNNNSLRLDQTEIVWEPKLKHICAVLSFMWVRLGKHGMKVLGLKLS